MTSPPVPPQAITADSVHTWAKLACDTWQQARGVPGASTWDMLPADARAGWEITIRAVLEAAAPHPAAPHLAAAVPTGIIHLEGGKLSEADLEELAARWKAEWRTGKLTILPDDTEERIAEAVAAERERCAQLAESEAAKLRAGGSPEWMAPCAGALEDFAALLRGGPAVSVLVAPARYVLTAAHIRHPAGERTLCGKPLAPDELWTVVEPDPEVPVCRGCQHAARKAAERAESHQEALGATGPNREVSGSAEGSAALTAPCCGLHGRNCEPPSELCCERCTEAGHPGHTRLGPCSSPDLSTDLYLNGATVAEDVREDRWRDAAS